jgi:hypothetical protein
MQILDADGKTGGGGRLGALRWPFRSSTGWAAIHGDVIHEVPVTASRGGGWQAPVGSPREYKETYARSRQDGRLLDGPKISVGVGSVDLTVDYRGNIYVVALVPMGNPSRCDALFGFPNHECYWLVRNNTPANYHFWRGETPVTHQNQIAEVVKFEPEGGHRQSDAEQWAFREADFINNFCSNCEHRRNMLAVDDADHIFAGDPVHHCVKVLDAAGNVVQWIGCYGNAGVVPLDGGSTRDLSFHSIYSVAAGDALCVTDRDLKRLALIRMGYWERCEAPIRE